MTKPNNDSYAVQAIDGKVVWVQHLVRYETGAEPNILETAKGLVAKYGPPKKDRFPQSQTNNTTMVWDYAADGTPIAAASCGAGTTTLSSAGMIESVDGPDENATTGYDSLSIVNGIVQHIDCSTQVVARLVSMQNRQLLNAFNVQIQDDGAIKAYFDRLKTAAEQQQNREAQKSLRNKAVF